MLSNLRIFLPLLLVTILLTGLALPVFAIEYNPGVAVRAIREVW